MKFENKFTQCLQCLDKPVENLGFAYDCPDTTRGITCHNECVSGSDCPAALLRLGGRPRLPEAGHWSLEYVTGRRRAQAGAGFMLHASECHLDTGLCGQSLQ